MDPRMRLCERKSATYDSGLFGSHEVGKELEKVLLALDMHSSHCLSLFLCTYAKKFCFIVAQRV